MKKLTDLMNLNLVKKDFPYYDIFKSSDMVYFLIKKVNRHRTRYYYLNFVDRDNKIVSLKKEDFLYNKRENQFSLQSKKEILNFLDGRRNIGSLIEVIENMNIRG